jgi:hypothetical protein
MIFGKYAERLESEHWLQPKRGSLMVKAAIGSRGPDRANDVELFEWVAKEYSLPISKDKQPTFLFKILSETQSLAEIPPVLNVLRYRGAVKDYRT